MKIIFVIEGSSGCYDDYRSWPIKAYAEKFRAECEAERLKKEQIKLADRKRRLENKVDFGPGSTYGKADEALEKFINKHGSEAGDVDFHIREITLYESKASK